jgi:phage-related protein
MDLLKRLSLVTGMSVAEMSKIVGRALTGDVEMLARTLGISKEQLAALSPEFAKFMENAQGAGEAQLGAVTRLGGSTEQIAGNALKALDEITTALGAGQEAIDEYASSAGGEIESLQGLWENFTEDVGKELLPIIQEALEKLITFIVDHKEDIDKFVNAFGDFAAEGFDKLMEWVDSGGAEQFAESMGSMADAGKNLKSAFDWLAKAAEDLNNFVQSFNEVYTKITGASAPGNIDMLSVNPNAPLQKILNNEMPTIGPTSETMPDWMKSVGDWFKEVLGQQEVNVKVTVDDDGKIKTIVDKQVNETVGNLVNGITGQEPQ